MDLIRVAFVTGILLSFYDNVNGYTSTLIRWNTDSKYNGFIPTSGGYKPDMTSSNAIQCARLCKDIPEADCVGFVYLSDSSTCQLHNTTWILSDDVTMETSASYYQLKMSSTTITCPAHWVEFGSGCYLFNFDTQMNFSTAETFCRQKGGNLVHIGSHEENEFVKGRCRDVGIGQPAWVGINDIATEGRWVWHGTETDTPFTDWYAGQPNQGTSANCGVIWHGIDFAWADEPCDKEYYPICELTVITN